MIDFQLTLFENHQHCIENYSFVNQPTTLDEGSIITVLQHLWPNCVEVYDSSKENKGWISSWRFEIGLNQIHRLI